MGSNGIAARFRLGDLPAAPDHPMKGEALLAERGVDEEIRRAILSHAQLQRRSQGQFA